MSVLTATNLAMHYGAQDVFSGISVAVAHGDRIALVGPNGGGKTTLLRILCGLETPSEGVVQTARGLRVGYLPQQADLSGEVALYDEMLGVFQELRAQQAELRRLEEAMADPATRQEALARYGDLQLRFELAGGYAYEDRIRQVLGHLGFAEGDLQLPLRLLSGGQRTRALLARLILSEPDLLLLDEPTNHLDMPAIEWLEETLLSWPGSLILVAHDRRFLDVVASRVWELSDGRLEEYPGNYSKYVQLRAERRARRLAEFEAQQEQIARTEDFIRRNLAGQRSKEAKGRRKRLQRLERVEKPHQEKALRLELRAGDRAGDIVIHTRQLVVGYDDDAPGGGRRLFSSPDLLLRRGERAALLGPNGSGKTTFLRTLLGQVQPLSGQAQLGHNVRIGYFAQAQEGLDPDRTVLEEVLAAKDLPLGEARGFLGRFLFSGDHVFKRVSTLSGGERARVALAKLTLQGANLLLLDEPTNHLDIPSQEALQTVLERYDGTILFVTHDRWLVDALATQVWVVEGDRLRVHAGGYSAYLATREQEAAAEKAARAARPARGARGASR
ncbi:MAG: ABC-F family ATP-binding cassette domain-containing protein, partial [Anaerolineae bacterium]|nr:ABC-F family ATP-binding cassette domain-containing protein [Anaerolineae bacterium]